MRKRVAASLQVAGGVSAALAGFLMSPVAGFLILGAGLVVFGIAVEREAEVADAEQSAGPPN